jgi:nitrate reductase NapE component
MPITAAGQQAVKNGQMGLMGRRAKISFLSEPTIVLAGANLMRTRIAAFALLVTIWPTSAAEQKGRYLSSLPTTRSNYARTRHTRAKTGDSRREIMKPAIIAIGLATMLCVAVLAAHPASAGFFDPPQGPAGGGTYNPYPPSGLIGQSIIRQ